MKNTNEFVKQISTVCSICSSLATKRHPLFVKGGRGGDLDLPRVLKSPAIPLLKRGRNVEFAKCAFGFKPKLQSLIAACLTTLILHTPAANAAIAGKVQFTYGNVKVTTPTGITRPLIKGEAVNEGDSITTALTSSTQIKMMDGGLVAVRPDTKMKFDKFVFNGKQDGTERGYFTLVKGGFRAVTGLVGRANKHNYKISTPTATIGIRGTDHETYVVAQGAPNAAAGAYSKVNVGETTLTTNKGAVNVLPNQMGFSSGLNELPKLQPINTNLFTVSAAPTKTIKETKQEKKETDEKKEAEKQSTQETKQATKEENKKESTQETKQDTAQDTKQTTKPAATTTAATETTPPPATSDAKAGGTATSTTPAPPESPATVTDAAPLRTDTKMDAPANILAVTAAAPVAVQAPVVEAVATPVTPAVVEAKPVVTVAMTDTSGNTLDATNQTVTTSTNQTATVTAVVEVIAANTNPANPTAPVSIATAVAKVINPVVTDTIANLLNDPSVTLNTDVVVLDAATLAQLASLKNKIGTGVLTYSSVIDNLANLNSNAGGYVVTGTTIIIRDTIANLTANTPGYSIAGKNVVVTDVATLAQLTTLATNNAGITLNASTINDGVLALSTSTYVKPGVNLTVTDAANLAQLATLAGKNTGGTLTATTINDGVLALSTSTYVIPGVNVTVTDAANLAQLATLASKNTGGTLNATTINDGVLALSTSAFVKPNVNVTVTDTASLAQLATLAGKNFGGTLNYTSVGDTVAALSNNTIGYPAGVNLKVTDVAAISELLAISATNKNGSVTATMVSDNSTNLISNIGTYVLPATNVTVTNAVNIADLTTIDNAAGVVSYQTIIDTTNNIISGIGGYVASGKNVTVTDAASIAQLTSINGNRGSGTLTYSALTDTAANLATNTGGFVAGGKSVNVSDAGSIAQLAAIKLANGGAALTYTALSDTAANLAANAGNFVANGTNISVTDTATVAQLNSIDGANGTGPSSGTLTYVALSDTAATLNGSAYVTPGKNVTITDAASFAQLSNIDGANGSGTSSGTLVYTTLADTIANLNATAGNYLVAGKNVAVTDTGSLAQLAALDAVNGAGTLSFTTVNNANATHRVLFEPTVTGGVHEGYLWADNPVAATSTTYVFDANKNLTQIQGTYYETWDQTALVQAVVNSNIVFNGGTSSDNFAAADGSIYMGRWSGGSMTVTDLAASNPLAPFNVIAGTTSTHWLLAQMPAEISPGVSLVKNMVGTANYTLSAATHPTDTFGNVGSVTAASLIADFTTQTLATTAQFTFSTTDQVNVSTKNRVFDINQSGISFDANASSFQTFGAATLPSASCTGTDCSGFWFVGLEGGITGAAGLTAFVDYNLYNTVSSTPTPGTPYVDMVRSIVAFNTATAPTTGTNPPVGATSNWESFSHLAVGTAGSWGRGRFNDGLLAQTNTNFVLDGSGNLVTSRHVQYNERATWNLTGGTNNYADANVTYSGGVASDYFQVADGSLTIGRWTGGQMTITDNNGVLAPLVKTLGLTSAYWGLGTSTNPSVVQSLIGTTTFTQVGATLPTDTFGNVGTVPVASLVANFTAMTVDTSVAFSIANQNLSVAATAVSIVPGGNYFDATLETNNAPTVTCTGTCAGTGYLGWMTGTFYGAGAGSADVSYKIWPTAPQGSVVSDIIQGVVAFDTISAPSVGISPGVGNWESYGRGIAGTVGAWKRAGFNNNALVPNTSFVFDGAGNLVKVLNHFYSERYEWNSVTSAVDFPDATIAHSGGTAQDLYQLPDGSLTIGRWTGGQLIVTDNTGVQNSLVKDLGLTSMIWGLISPVPNSMVPLLIGTASYTMQGATLPTDSFGNTGSITSASVMANFTSQTADASVVLNIANKDLTATATGVPFNYDVGIDFYASAETGMPPSVSCAGIGCSGSYSGILSGWFAGGSAAGLDLKYRIWPTATENSLVTDVIQGAIALSTATAPSVGTNPPVGATSNWESFSHLAVGTAGSWGRGRFNDGSLAQTNTNYILDASGNLVTSQHVQYNERATWNLSGSVNNYADAKVTYSGGVASDYFQVADGSLTIGRWTGGQMTITDNNGILAPLVKNLGLTSAYWGLGTSTNPSVVQTLIGTTTFTQVGATLPTDTFGNVGTVPVASLVANFTAMTVDTSVGFTIANQNLSVAATAVSIVPGGNYFDAALETNNAPTVTCTGTCAGTGYLGWMTGTFYGAGAGSADVSYKIWPTAPQGSVVSDIIQGVVAFSAGTAPTLGTNPATGLYQNVVGRIYITSPTDVISGNAFNAAPLASSNILLDAAGNVVRVSQMNVNTSMAIAGGTTATPNQQVTFSGGVAHDYFKMADNSITFGRWLGGDLLIDDPVTLARTTVALKANDGITPTSGIWYMTTPLQSTNYVQSLTGTSNYNKVADVLPTDSFGNVGTLNSATLTANFLTQTVDAVTNFTILTSTYDVSATGMPILIDSFLANPTAAIVPTVTCLQGGLACAGTYQGRLAGNFAGNTASSILLQYAAWPTTTTGVPAADTIRGLVAFDTLAPPTLAPTKAMAVTLQDANAFGYLWNNTFTTLPGNINTAMPNPGYSLDWGSGSASGESLSLAGATGAVNGSATSVATTGIQFGRYDGITSYTQANWGSFNGLVGWNRTGQWAYGVTGYLDNSSILSTASNGTVTGQFGYVLDGAQSAPIDWNGNKGVLNSLALKANFANSTLDATLKATTGATIWNASSTGVSISSFNPYFNAGGNSAGQVSTVTKGTLGTESCTTCSWYLTGAFTGQNYAGAVVSFSLSDNSTSVDASELQGVAALTRTGGTVSGLANPLVGNATGTVAPTTNVVATTGANTGTNVQTQISATLDANNVLTNFGSTTITCISCTGALAPDFANTGIRLGTWDVGTSASSWTNTLSGAQFHWITGPSAPVYLVQSLIGTANYTLDGGTAPTSQTQGVTGVSTGVINSASMTLDFNKQAIGLNFSVSSGAHNWVVSTPLGSEAPLGNNNGDGSASFKAATGLTGPGALSVMLDGVDVSSSLYGSKVSGQLTGDTLNGALFQYQLAGDPSKPNAVGTNTFTDSIAVIAPDSTMITNGATFPNGTTGTFVVQAPTTVSLTSTDGTTISSLSTTGGVTMNVASLTQQAGDTYAGVDSTTTEAVEVTIFSGAYSNLTGGLSYSSYGWVRKHPNGQPTLAGPFANIYFAGGTDLTVAAAMPQAISATYTGGMQGAAQDSTSNILYLLMGTTSLTADFTNSTILGSITGISTTDVSTQLAAGSFNDLTISGTIVSSGFSGGVSAGVLPAAPSPVAIATGATATGTSSGHFYGPNANEVSGTWALSSGTISASGAYGAANAAAANSAGLQTVNGTVALVQTSVNGVPNAAVNTATPARLMIETHNDLTGGFQASGDMNNATRVTTVAGAVTGFDMNNNNNNSNLAFSTSKAVSIGTAISVNVGSDATSGFSWGRWEGGNLQYTDRVTNAVTSVLNKNLHWLAGPTTTNVVLPVSGTFNYTLVGGTNPTDNLGNVGTLTSASLQANFTAQTVNMGVNASVNAINYVATGTNMPIQNGGFSNDSGGTYTATANGSAVQGFAGGIFTGATGTGAGVVYGFTNGATVVNGVAAFSRP